MTTVSLRHWVELNNQAARVVAYTLTSQRQQARRELAEALGRAADLGLRAAGSRALHRLFRRACRLQTSDCLALVRWHSGPFSA